MVDVVIGTKTNTAAADALIEQVKAIVEPETTLYLEYPVVSTATDSTTIDAMLTSPHHGVIIFDFFLQVIFQIKTRIEKSLQTARPR